jgi:hypothetical protein
MKWLFDHLVFGIWIPSVFFRVKVWLKGLQSANQKEGVHSDDEVKYFVVVEI